ncbi:hypothetical protein RCKEEF_87 [Rhodobacter phage RcKeef]|nr:hypothetical protein RCKEEF_87 [Rhodobacter phage RcKeef]
MIRTMEFTRGNQMTMQAEYVIWGKEKGKTDALDEVPLYTKAESMEQAERVMTILEREHGCHSMRVQVLDGTLPNFGAAVI